MLYSARRRAKQAGVPFDLDVDDLAVSDVCPVLGIPLVIGGEGGRSGPTDNSPSLDRFDPARGYVRGNVFVISKLANAIKQNATAEQVARVAEWMRSVAAANDTTPDARARS